ncbi:MAG: 2-C-methyl-D-erythritol 4-phosphate cytidylyltransferase, partial [Christensenellaceae bacterium]|nr:2-C-methyl-D-erythritol 4-phosphate cytidylyltransferase [Christensenellaceae bacterium]
MIFDVIIPASGSSVRFGGNKLMLPFGGVSVLENTVSAFLCRKNIKNIFVAVKEEDIEEVRKMLPYPQVIVCAGGETRFLSVYAGLNISTADAVLVHDAARPNVSQTLIDAVCSSVANRGSGVPSLPLSDSVRHILKDRIIGEDKNREHLVCVQTPQGYLAGELLDAYEQAFEDNC